MNAMVSGSPWAFDRENTAMEFRFSTTSAFILADSAMERAGWVLLSTCRATLAPYSSLRTYSVFY